MIGVLITDIYPRPSWDFVYGLASLTDKVGVFSFARYDDKFFNQNTFTDKEKLLYRSCKVMCHEISH